MLPDLVIATPAQQAQHHEAYKEVEDQSQHCCPPAPDLVQAPAVAGGRPSFAIPLQVERRVLGQLLIGMGYRTITPMSHRNAAS
ncbi:hypothetical protein KC338_g313 [Hortaea werneckii]|nr:hypothetical protein KC338_g313 [Hortaea werneckii]